LFWTNEGIHLQKVANRHICSCFRVSRFCHGKKSSPSLSPFVGEERSAGPFFGVPGFGCLSQKGRRVIVLVVGDGFSKLVGGLEHFFFFHVLGIIIPIDELIFSEGLKPPTRKE